jgi:molybdate transport system permease protein
MRTTEVFVPLWISLKVGITSTTLALILGTLVAYVIAGTRPKIRQWIESFVLLPLVLPPTVLGYFLLVLCGSRGPVGRIYESLTGEPLAFTLKAAVIAACVSTIPLVIRVMISAFASLSRETTEAARIDGAHGWSLFYRVHMPQVRPALTAAATIAFARAIGDFGATLMLAGNLPGRTQTASIAIYDYLNAGKDEQAMTMVMLISIVSVLLLFATSKTGTQTSA